MASLEDEKKRDAAALLDFIKVTLGHNYGWSQDKIKKFITDNGLAGLGTANQIYSKVDATNALEFVKDGHTYNLDWLKKRRDSLNATATNDQGQVLPFAEVFPSTGGAYGSSTDPSSPGGATTPPSNSSTSTDSAGNKVTKYTNPVTTGGYTNVAKVNVYTDGAKEYYFASPGTHNGYTNVVMVCVYASGMKGYYFADPGTHNGFTDVSSVFVKTDGTKEYYFDSSGTHGGYSNVTFVSVNTDGSKQYHGANGEVLGGGITQADKDAAAAYYGSITTSQEQATANLAKYGLDQDGKFAEGPFAGFTPDQVKAFTNGVTGSEENNDPPPVTGGGVVTDEPAPVTHFFTLIKAEGGDGSVYVLNNRGERFHVSETLMHEMQAGGSWYEPEVRPAADVNAMNLRYTVDSTANLGTINNATFDAGGHTYMLIKGDATDYKPDDVLVGNGRAIFAVDEHGNKEHVTGEAFAQLGAVPIATLTQAAADVGPIAGTLAAPGGTLTVTDPVMAQALAVATTVVNDTPAPAAPASTPLVDTTAPDYIIPDGVWAGHTNAEVAAFIANNSNSAGGAGYPTLPAPAPPVNDDVLNVTNSAESTGHFRIVQGDATEWKPDNQLVGNGRAIFVVNAAGQKFHVTGELMQAMQQDGTWHDPDRIPQGDVDRMKFGSGVSLTNIDQLRSINIGAGSEFKLIKDADNDSVFAVTSEGERYHVSAELAGKMGTAFSNIDTLNPGESSKFGAVKGELNTVAELNKAVKDDSTAASFDGDTSAIPGGFPPVQGYTADHM